MPAEADPSAVVVVAYGSNSDRSMPFPFTTPPLSVSSSPLPPPAKGVAFAAGVDAGIPFTGGFCAGAAGAVSVDGRGGGAGVARLFMDGFSGASVSSGWAGAGSGFEGRGLDEGSVTVGGVGGGLMLDLRCGRRGNVNVEKEYNR